MDGPQDCPKQICPEPPVYLPGGFSVSRLQKSDLKPWKSWKMMISVADEIPYKQIFEVEMFAVSFVNKAMLKSWWLQTKRGGRADDVGWSEDKGHQTPLFTHIDRCFACWAAQHRVTEKKHQMQKKYLSIIYKKDAKVVPCQFPGAPFTFLPGDGVLFPAPFKTASFFFPREFRGCWKKHVIHPDNTPILKLVGNIGGMRFWKARTSNMDSQEYIDTLL